MSATKVDYSSIPQKHKGSQLLAINSLALYASIANALIVAVPQAKHVSTNFFADAESYQARAWCRAEQFCYSIGHGSNNLWVASSPDPADIKLADSRWLATCLLVFEGEWQPFCRLRHVSCAPVLSYSRTQLGRMYLCSPYWPFVMVNVAAGEMTCCAMNHQINGAEQSARLPQCAPAHLAAVWCTHRKPSRLSLMSLCSAGRVRPSRSPPTDFGPVRPDVCSQARRRVCGERREKFCEWQACAGNNLRGPERFGCRRAGGCRCFFS